MVRKRILNRLGQPVDSRGKPILKKPNLVIPGKRQGSGLVLDSKGRPLKSKVVIPNAKEVREILPRFADVAKRDPVLENSRAIMERMKTATNGTQVLSLIMQSRLFKDSILTGKLKGIDVIIPGKGAVVLEKVSIRDLNKLSAEAARRLFADLTIAEYERKKAEWEKENERIVKGTPESRIIKGK
jgi:hypothetical protein